MADFRPRFVDLVRNYTTTVGTDDFVLGPAVNGYSDFATVCQVGERFYYSALGVDNPSETEVGRGTLLDGGVIAREPIGGTKTNFFSGTKTIALIAAAEWFDAAQALVGSAMQAATGRDALASFSGAAPAFLTEAARAGTFLFDSSDHSAHVAADTAQGIYVAPASDPTGASGAWVRRFDGQVNAGWFGLIDGDDAANAAANTAAFSAMLATLAARREDYPRFENGVERIMIPCGVYWFADAGAGAAIELTDAVILEGHSVGYEESAPILKFLPGVSGIRVQDANTSGANTFDAVTHNGARGTVIRNLALAGSFSTVEAEAHGVIARTVVRCEHVHANNFEGDGFHVAVSTNSPSGGEPPYGNANMSAFTNCGASGNRNGIFFGGSDANACTILNFNANSNRQAGIYDASFLGNSYFGGQLAGNGTHPVNDGVNVPAAVVSYGGNYYGCIVGQEAGASSNAPTGTADHNVWWYYISPGDPAPGGPAWTSGMLVRPGGPVIDDQVTSTSVYNGVYAENSDAKAQIAQRSIVVGGMMATWIFNNPAVNRGTAVLRGGNTGALETDTCLTANAGTVMARLGAMQGNPSTIIINASEPTCSPGGHQLRFANQSGGSLILTYGNTPAASAYAFSLTGPATTEDFGSGVAQPHTLYVPRLALGPVSPGTVNARRIYVDSAAPTAGDHGQGDFVHACSASAGLIGWICRTAGSPGTWEAVYSGFGTGQIGYAAGAGSSATQLTVKSAGVTLNTLSGQIVLSNATLAAGAVATFAVSNNQVAVTDTIILNLKGGQVASGSYRYWVDRVQAGSFSVSVENRSSGPLSEALIFNFAIVKAVAA